MDSQFGWAPPKVSLGEPKKAMADARRPPRPAEMNSTRSSGSASSMIRSTSSMVVVTSVSNSPSSHVSVSGMRCIRSM